LRFADPVLLALLVLLPLLGLYAGFTHRQRSSVGFGALGAAAKPRSTWRVRLERWLVPLRLVAIALLIVALARPQRGEAVTTVRGEGIDIVLAYDVSSSMSQPFARGQSRLEAAERVLTNFVTARGNDRVGLVAFQGASITMSPLTTDYAALAVMVDQSGGLQLTDGTGIGVAIGQSVNELRDSSAASRIVILMTDGENNVATIEPLAAARLAESLGIRVYTIGVVSPGFDRSQSSINVDEESLREIANVTGGTYSRAENPTALEEIYANIDTLEKSRFESTTVMRYDEIAPIVLAVAAVILAVEIVARYGLLRRAA
jgi:Ca-activated chloride channel family protein